jgi:hypothetical protein
MSGAYQLVVQLLSDVNEMKFQIPSTKLQTIPNFQNPNDPNQENINDEVSNFGYLKFEFVWDLDIGIWKFRRQYGRCKIYQE